MVMNCVSHLCWTIYGQIKCYNYTGGYYLLVSVLCEVLIIACINICWLIICHNVHILICMSCFQVYFMFHV